MRDKREQTRGLAASALIHKLWEFEELIRYATPDKPIPDAVAGPLNVTLGDLIESVKADLGLHPNAPKQWED